MEHLEGEHQGVLQRIRKLDITGMFASPSKKRENQDSENKPGTSNEQRADASIADVKQEPSDDDAEVDASKDRQYDVDLMYELKRAQARKARRDSDDVMDSLWNLSDRDDEQGHQQNDSAAGQGYDEACRAFNASDQHRAQFGRHGAADDREIDESPSPTGSFATAHSRLTRRSSRFDDETGNDLDYDIADLSDVDTIAGYSAVDTPRTNRSYRSTAWQTAYESADELSEGSSSFTPNGTPVGCTYVCM
jgi:hypothetical protein